MKTEVVMIRDLFGCEISQKSKSEFLSATDLQTAGNKWRVTNGLSIVSISQYFKTESAKQFIEVLEKKYGEVKIGERGRGKHTWVHPILFIDMALYFSPVLKVEVYEWLIDYLLKYRNDSGDSYRKMCGAIFETMTNKKHFQAEIIKTAKKIKEVCKVDDWQRATQEQLKQRDDIHNGICMLCNVLRDTEQVVDIAIKEVFKE